MKAKEANEAKILAEAAQIQAEHKAKAAAAAKKAAEAKASHLGEILPPTSGATTQMPGG